jgi:L-alanine-DL-glutamate epimerase-like enolase superfamily enzyme
MVGETSILSAAGRHFLANVPGVRFAEGSYGRFLLKGDVVERPVRFGYGGKVRVMTGFGWGVEVKRELLERYAEQGVLELTL